MGYIYKYNYLKNHCQVTPYREAQKAFIYEICRDPVLMERPASGVSACFLGKKQRQNGIAK